MRPQLTLVPGDTAPAPAAPPPPTSPRVPSGPAVAASPVRVPVVPPRRRPYALVCVPGSGKGVAHWEVETASGARVGWFFTQDSAREYLARVEAAEAKP